MLGFKAVVGRSATILLRHTYFCQDLKIKNICSLLINANYSGSTAGSANSICKSKFHLLKNKQLTMVPINIQTTVQCFLCALQKFLSAYRTAGLLLSQLSHLEDKQEQLRKQTTRRLQRCRVSGGPPCLANDSRGVLLCYDLRAHLPETMSASFGPTV